MNTSASSWCGHTQLPVYTTLPVQRQPNLSALPSQTGQQLQLSSQQQFTPLHDEGIRNTSLQASMGTPHDQSSSGQSSEGTFSANYSDADTTPPRSQQRPGPINADSARSKAVASRLVPIEPPLQSNANSSARDPSPIFKTTKTSRFWIPDPPCGPTRDWVNWVTSHASDSMPPSVITKALRALTRASKATGESPQLGSAEASPDVVLHAVHSLLKLSVAHADANPEMVLEQVARSTFLRRHLPTHPACWNAVLTLFTRAATAHRTFSDPLSVSQLAVSQVRLRCQAPLFWEQLSGTHVAQIDSYPAPQIVNLVWAAAKLDVEVPELLMHQLHRAVLRVLPECNDRNIASLVWGFAKNASLRHAKDAPAVSIATGDAFSVPSTSTGQFAAADNQTVRSGNRAGSKATQQLPDAAKEALGGASSWIADPSRALSASAVPFSWLSPPDTDFGIDAASTLDPTTSGNSMLDSAAPNEADLFKNVWSELTTAAVARAETMAPRALSTVAWAMGSMRHPGTRHAAHALAHHALAVMPILSAHETANVAWACARLQVPLSPNEASELLIRVVHHCMPHMHAVDEDADESSAYIHRASGFTPQGFANSVWALGTLRADAVATGVSVTPRSACSGDLEDLSASLRQASVATGVTPAVLGASEVPGNSGSASAARDAAYSASEGTGVSPKAALCAALMTLLPRLSAQELATALSGLSKLQGGLAQCDIDTALTAVSRRASTFSAIELGAILCASARLRARWGLPQETLLATFLTLAVNNVSGRQTSSGAQRTVSSAMHVVESAAPPQATANVAWALAKSRGYVLDDEGTIEFALMHAAPHWSSQELSNVFWALSTCGHSINSALAARLSQAAKRTAPCMNAQELALTMTGLVKTRIGLELPEKVAVPDVWGAEEVPEGSVDGAKGLGEDGESGEVAEVLQEAIVRCWYEFTPQTAAAVSWAVAVVAARVSGARVARAMRAALALSAVRAGPMEAAISLHSAAALSNAAAASATIGEGVQEHLEASDTSALFSTGDLQDFSNSSRLIDYRPGSDAAVHPEVLDPNGRLLRRLLRAVVRNSDAAPAVGVMCSLRAIHRLAQLARGYSISRHGTDGRSRTRPSNASAYQLGGGISKVLESTPVGIAAASVLQKGVLRHLAVLSDVDAMHAADAFVLLEWKVPQVLIDRVPHDAAVKLGLRERVPQQRSKNVADRAPVR